MQNMSQDEIHQNLKNAAESNNVESLQELLKMPEVRKEVDAGIFDRYNGKDGLLQYAVFKYNRDMAFLCLRHGADPFVHTGRGGNLFDYVRQSEYVGSVGSINYGGFVTTERDVSAYFALLINRLLEYDMANLKILLSLDSKMSNEVFVKPGETQESLIEKLLTEAQLQVGCMGLKIEDIPFKVLEKALDDSSSKFHEKTLTIFKAFLDKLEEFVLPDDNVRAMSLEDVCFTLYMQLANHNTYREKFFALLESEAGGPEHMQKNIKTLTKKYLNVVNALFLSEEKTTVVRNIISHGPGLFEPLRQISSYYMKEATPDDQKALSEIVMDMRKIFKKNPLAAGNTQVIEHLHDAVFELQQRVITGDEERVSLNETVETQAKEIVTLKKTVEKQAEAMKKIMQRLDKLEQEQKKQENVQGNSHPGGADDRSGTTNFWKQG